MRKQDYAKGLVVILDLPSSDQKELQKLSSDTLKRIFESQKKNAIAFQELKNG